MRIILQKFREKCKLWWEINQNDFFLLAIIVLLSTIFFGAWRLWFAGFYAIEPRLRQASLPVEQGFGGQAREIVIEENAFPLPPPSSATYARFIASVNGEKYYPIGCKAANRISKENIMWFASEKEARDMGYMPSSQCEK